MSPSVGSAVCTFTGDNKSNGAYCCSLQTSWLLEIDHSVWKQSYNASRTVLYSIDIGSVLVFNVQTDDTSRETEVSVTASVWLILCASLVCMLLSINYKWLQLA